jgi:hypothetical protein
MGKKVAAVLEGARLRGAETHTIRLREQHLKFCTNCRTCVYAPGPERGKCPGTMTWRELSARSSQPTPSCSSGQLRKRHSDFQAVHGAAAGVRLVAVGPAGAEASQQGMAPEGCASGLLGHAVPPMMVLFTGAATALRLTAEMLGAKPVGNLWLGSKPGDPHHELSRRALAMAERLGMKLA